MAKFLVAPELTPMKTGHRASTPLSLKDGSFAWSLENLLMRK